MSIVFSGGILLVCALTLILSGCSHAVVPVESVRPRQLAFSVLAGPALPQGRGGHAAGMVDGKLFVIGGNRWNEAKTEKVWHADSLILRDGTWQAGPSLTHPLAYPAFCQVGRSVVLAGGSNGKTMIASAYLVSGKDGSIEFKELPPLPAAFDAAGCAAVDNIVYVIGGETPEGMLKTVWALDLAATGRGWQKRAAMTVAGRSFSAVFVRDSKIYMLGGISNWNPLTSHHDCHLYDPARDAWSALPSMEIDGYAWSAEPVDSNHVLLAGRANGQIYDGIWLIGLPDLSTRLVGHTFGPTATAPLVHVRSGEWWLIGGEPDSNKNRTPRVAIIRTDS